MFSRFKVLYEWFLHQTTATSSSSSCGTLKENWQSWIQNNNVLTLGPLPCRKMLVSIFRSRAASRKKRKKKNNRHEQCGVTENNCLDWRSPEHNIHAGNGIKITQTLDLLCFSPAARGDLLALFLLPLCFSTLPTNMSSGDNTVLHAIRKKKKASRHAWWNVRGIHFIWHVVYFTYPSW